MKYIKRLKRMKNSTKIGLATSAVYAASAFVIPAFANTTEKKVEQPVFQPVDVYNIKSIEQVDKIYAEQVKLSTEDGAVSYKEIKNLENILDRKRNLFWYQSQELRNEVSLSDKTYEIDDKIREVEYSIGELESKMNSKEVYVSPELEQIKNDFNRRVMRFFPYLIRQPMFYSAYQPVEEQLSKAMKELTLRTDEFLKTYYNDDSLKALSGKENYVIKDIIAFYNILHENRSKVLFDAEIKEGKQKLREKLRALEKEKEQLKKSNWSKIKEAEKKISALESKINNVMEEKAPFERYLAAKENIEDYIEEWADFSNYTGFSISLMYEDTGRPHDPIDSAKLKYNKQKFEWNNKRAVERLRDSFKNLGYDVSIEGLKNPAKTMFPWPWGLNALFGGVFPLFRNILSAKFIRRDVDLFDVVEGALIEPLLFTLFLDGVFPLMGAIRLFGAPFLFEPIRKWTGWRDIE